MKTKSDRIPFLNEKSVTQHGGLVKRDVESNLFVAGRGQGTPAVSGPDCRAVAAVPPARQTPPTTEVPSHIILPL